ncbi:MAG TPA: hypothetical protein VLM79_17885 [Kofleriaceae bacterium]|nr:hypothetical protein [Kofleriaceae bacterium]
MTAYKFLATGALGPLSGFAWPVPIGEAPGPWVEADGPLAVGARGTHVCRPTDLAHWLHNELWEIEVAGDTLEGPDCLVVRRARLVRRIAAWSAGGAERFARACIAHGAAEGDGAMAGVGRATSSDVAAFLDDAAQALASGYPAIAAFCAAMAVSRSGGAGRADGEAADTDGAESAYRRERAWQSAWIARELL